MRSAVTLTLVVFLLAPLCALAEQSFDAGCRTREAEACPANPVANPLLALAGDCALDLRRNRNCCAHSAAGARDYAIVRDCAANKPQAYLLIPVKPITGVDDPQIFAPAYAGLWAQAWRWSREFPGQPASHTGLAINSAGSRSEQQLHIHISCVDRDVSAALETSNIPRYPAKPHELADFGPGHHTYKAVRVRKLTGENSPFRIVLRRVGKSAMRHHGIAVIGSRRAGEYYVLSTTEIGGRGGHAEELLDQSCAK